jgi:EAL domain-containing protein (putative c-di-GMP-specific phosphodiesterase class I)
MALNRPDPSPGQGARLESLTTYEYPNMRFSHARQGAVERLLWSRDSRFISRVAQSLPQARVIAVADSGWCVLDGVSELTESRVRPLAMASTYGLVDVDPALPASERYVVALGNAVQVSGMGDRIGMDETPEAISRRILDYFFALKENHHVEFQPIVDLRTMQAHEWECLFRPHMPMLPQTISTIVDAALIAKRPVDFDMFVVEATLDRIAEVAGPATLGRRARYGINLLPASLLAPHFEAGAFAERVRRVGLSPRQIVVECTEQQAIADIGRLKKQVRALRRLGFGFAIDDAGAGYASFNVIAALEPSIIKIAREIVCHIGNKDSEAKKALVEAFVSFSRRIGAKVVAEGIENRRDLLALQEREVDFGQGFLLGRSSTLPVQPRRIRTVRKLPLVIQTVGGWEAAVRDQVASSG